MMETNMELKKIRSHTYIHTTAVQLFESLKKEPSILIFFKYFKIRKIPSLHSWKEIGIKQVLVVLFIILESR
jgi:hypothetical protein